MARKKKLGVAHLARQGSDFTAPRPMTDKQHYEALPERLDPFGRAAIALAYERRCQEFGWTRPELLVVLPNDLPLCPDCKCCNMRRVGCSECDGTGISDGDEDDEWPSGTCSNCDGESGWWLCMGPCPHDVEAASCG